MVKRPTWITALLSASAVALLAAGCSDDCDYPAAGKPDGAVVLDGAVEEDQEATPDQATTSAARTIELKTFNEVLAAHKAGKQLRAIFKYEECKLDGGPGLRATGGMYPVAVEYVAKGPSVPRSLITFSDAKLILNPQLYPIKKDAHVYNTAWVRLFEDGSVVVLSNYLDFVTEKVTMAESWECALGGGKGAYLYLDNPAATPDEPVQLKTYDAALAAVIGGEPVTALIDLSKCQPDGSSDKHAASDPATISMAVATFEWFDMPASGISNRIVWSETNLVRDPQNPTAGSFVYRYVKISLKATGDAQLTRQYFDAATGAASLHQTYACQLDTGDGTTGLRMVSR